MLKRGAFIFAIVGLLIEATVLAQADDPLAAIPACSSDQQQLILELVSGSGIGDTIGRIGNEARNLSSQTPRQMSTLLSDEDVLQVTWQTLVLPTLPNCSLTYQLDRSLGQFIDELALTTNASLLAQVSGNNIDVASVARDIAQAHGGRLSGLQGDFSTLLDSLPNTGAATPEAVSTSENSPLSFSGNKDQVLGPITIPNGIYRARVTTAQSIIVEINPISGECGQGTGNYLSTLLFSLNEANGAEAVLTSRGCRTLIAVSLVSAPWTLEFEKVG